MIKRFKVVAWLSEIGTHSVNMYLVQCWMVVVAVVVVLNGLGVIIRQHHKCFVGLVLRCIIRVEQLRQCLGDGVVFVIRYEKRNVLPHGAIGFCIDAFNVKNNTMEMGRRWRKRNENKLGEFVIFQHFIPL